jgi:CheY-like chemotaxis protein
MDGLEATEEIRKFEKERERYTPIIAMTALATKADKDRCIEHGMDDYITKPIRKDLIIKMLQKYGASKK